MVKSIYPNSTDQVIFLVIFPIELKFVSYVFKEPSLLRPKAIFKISEIAHCY